MRRTLPCWAIAALLAGPSACAAGAASSRAYEPSAAPMDYSRAAAPTEAVTASAEESYGGVDDAPSASMALAKAAPPPPPAQPGAAPRPAPAGAAAQPQAQPPGEASAVRAPMLIYTAQISMAVFEVSASLGKVESLAKELGGFLARRDDRTVTIRVPAARFDEALTRIADLGDMLHRDVVAQDVTEEFLDLEVRLRNARAVRDRLEKLLDKATKVEESIQLERELARVAGEIERLEGRMKYLRDRATFSTITVSFQPRSSETIRPSAPRLPVTWLNELGLARLLNL